MRTLEKFLRLKQTLIKRRGTFDALVVGISLIIMLPMAAVFSETLTHQRFNIQMEDMRQGFQLRSNELRLQLSDSLERLNQISLRNTAESHCTGEIYKQQMQLIQDFRYINEVALRLKSGAICHSFGEAEYSGLLPSAGDVNHYSSVDGTHYWFSAGPNFSADNGRIIVSTGSGYVWLNKGLILDVLSISKDVSFDLLDKDTQQSRFSNNRISFQLAEPLPVEKLGFSNDRLVYPFATKWGKLSALITMPANSYSRVWGGIFTTVMLSGLVLIFVFYRFAVLIYHYRRSLTTELRRSLAGGRLKVHYQPIVDIRTGQWKGAEALLRWSVKGKTIPPSVFIPLAEKSGLITEVTREVCRQVAIDHATYLWACDDFYLSINLSAADINDTTFPDFVGELFSTHDICPQKIVFEVTETSMVNKDVAVAQLQRLRDMGHQIAVDDFGTGYSSLSYLEDLPFDILKLDRSFLTLEKMESPDSIVWYVIRLAHSLNLSVIAEGLENQAQADFLYIARVSLAQGWLYSRELPIVELAQGFFAIALPPGNEVAPEIRETDLHLLMK
ncbi:EAL domain-containing protein [Pseudomonas moorei]|uniref:EAL domain-containing protein n=1 Tax=Pseudomonas moorei TaxID=395599 RepID=UPI00200CE3DF|nr:EAL domain-containing protein [Pseudomonas moorei]